MDDSVEKLAGDNVAASPESSAQFKLFGSFDAIIAVFANYIQVASFVVPAVGVIVTAISALIDLFSNSDTLNEISQKLDELIRFEHGFQQHLDMLAITTLLGPAEVDVADLKKFGATSPFIDVPSVIRNTALPEHEIGSKSTYWQRPFFPELGFHDDFWYAGELQPPTVGDPTGVQFVFDPRLALPAYCEAIPLRLSARALIDPHNFDADWGDEVDASIEHLSSWLAVVVSGLKPRRMPSTIDILQLAADRQMVTLWPRVLGAVDIWDGKGIIGIYPMATLFETSRELGLLPAFFADIQDTNRRISTGELRDPELTEVLNEALAAVAAIYPALVVRHRLGTLARLKALALSRSVVHVWSMIQGMKRTRSRNDVEHVNSLTAWSLREIHTAIGDLLAEPDEDQQLVHVRGSDVTRRLAVLGGVSPDRRISLRTVLQAACA